MWLPRRAHCLLQNLSIEYPSVFCAWFYFSKSPNTPLSLLVGPSPNHQGSSFLSWSSSLVFANTWEQQSQFSWSSYLFFYYFDNMLSPPQTSHLRLPLFCTYATLSVMDEYNITFRTEQPFLQICSSWLWGPQCNDLEEPRVAEEIWEGFTTTWSLKSEMNQMDVTKELYCFKGHYCLSFLPLTAFT